MRPKFRLIDTYGYIRAVMEKVVGYDPDVIHKTLYERLGNKHFYDKLLVANTGMVGLHLFKPVERIWISNELQALQFALTGNPNNPMFTPLTCVCCGARGIQTPLGIVTIITTDQMRYLKDWKRTEEVYNRIMSGMYCFRYRPDTYKLRRIIGNNEGTFDDMLRGHESSKTFFKAEIERIKPLFITANNRIVKHTEQEILNASEGFDWSLGKRVLLLSSKV